MDGEGQAKPRVKAIESLQDVGLDAALATRRSIYLDAWPTGSGAPD